MSLRHVTLFQTPMKLLVVFVFLFSLLDRCFSVYVIPSSIASIDQDGTLKRPFSSIRQARDHLRGSSERRLVLYPTYYFLWNDSLVFNAEDSGRIYTKMSDKERKQIPSVRRRGLIELDQPVLSGGVRLMDWIEDRGVRRQEGRVASSDCLV